MSKKHRFFVLSDGRQMPVVETDSGQLVVKVSPAEWDKLTDELKEEIIQADNALAKEWAGGAIYIQGRPGPDNGPIWKV